MSEIAPTEVATRTYRARRSPRAARTHFIERLLLAGALSLFMGSTAAEQGALRVAAALEASDRPTSGGESLAPAIADLQVTKVTAPASASTQQSIGISWTVRNAATVASGAATSSSWQDSVYLSAQPVCCEGAVLVGSWIHSGGLAPGASYRQSPMLTVPDVRPGSYYLIVWTDATNTQPEADDANNQRAMAVTITSPDLVLTSVARAPTSASTQQSIPVSWTVLNQGTGPAVLPWEDRIYLSPNPTCCAGAIALGTWPRAAELAAGRKYSVARTLTLPNVDPGHYYLIARANASGVLHEELEANNEQAVQLTVTTPDLTPTVLNAPVSAAPGDSVSITWSVRNAGSGPAVGTWTDALYLAPTTACCVGATLVGRWERSTLAAGEQYTQAKQVVIPAVAPGNAHLILRTDVDDALHESDETNNHRAVPLAVTGADLVLSAFTAPPSASGGQRIAVSWTVENQGTGSANGPWVDRLLISQTPACCDSASELGSWVRATGVAPHSSYVQKKSIVVPNVSTDTYYLILWTDADQHVPDANHGNNRGTLPISLTGVGPIPGPTSLAIGSVNGGTEPIAGAEFEVVVQSRDAAGIRRAVGNPTSVTLTVTSGTGALGGVLTGTIPAGASEAVIRGVTYTKAESGVVFTARSTSGDLLTAGKSDRFAVKPGAIANYVMGVASPQRAGVPFPVTVSARDRFNNTVSSDSSTTVTLSSTSGHVLFDGNGDGAFGDATKVLTAGELTVMAKSDKAETATLGAIDARGMSGSASVTVVAAAASALAFTTQPGNAAAGQPIPGPPTVSIQDGFGNPVTSHPAVIGVAIGTNPTGSALAGTTVKTASNGVAGFADLAIAAPAAGYTLTAAAAGLTGATSRTFAVGSGGAAISGRVARASDGSGIAGSTISALQAGMVKGSASTAADGTYSMPGLSPGTYDVRASALGFQPQTVTGIAVSAGVPATVNFSLTAASGPAIRITDPTPGSALDRLTILVRGELTAPEGAELGVSVNDMPGFVDGSRFAALVPVHPGTTALVANATSYAGVMATDSVPITVLPAAADPPVHLRAIPAGGPSPLTVSFSLWSTVTVTDIALDVDGDGTAEFHGPTLDGRSFVLTRPGTYLPRATVTDRSGQSYVASTVVEVIDVGALDRRLQAVWRGIKDALRTGNTAAAVALIHSDTRERYREQFDQLSAATLANVDSIMTSITFVEVGFGGAQYEMLRQQEGQTFSYAVWFQLDQDGLWRLRRF